ncbi:50S ribosome-binding GTPase [Candidatus Woesearchaeota archaeon]|nr:50S ribosome-binding GTPase [Candidatus Woesearchaeota archaeon]
MNFERVPPVPSAQELLDVAFRRAREHAQSEKRMGTLVEIIRQKEAVKFDVMHDRLVSTLDKTMHSLPETMKLPPFYQQLMEITLDVPQFKKSCGALNWAIQKLKAFHSVYSRKLHQARNQQILSQVSKEGYGRIASIIKQIKGNLAYLEQCRRILKSYPDVKEMFTVCIYGFPNVGKTTLLNRLTGRTAEVASYAFTTKSINAGYFTVDGKMIQVLDVPGTLARPEKMNNIEKQAELVRTDLANVVVYVFDLTETSGYTTEKQEELFKRLGSEKPVLVYVSKTDLTENKVMKGFKQEYYSVDELKEKIVEMVK